MIASQVKSVVQDEVFELPPYADSILIESSGSIVLKHSPTNGSDYYAVTLDDTGLAAGLEKPTTELLFKYLKFTTLTGTAKIHYRVSKR